MTAPSRRPASASVLAAIAVGGALGGSARHGLTLLLPASPTTAFPWVTLCINTAGSFLLGFLLSLMLERLPPTRHLRPFLATGLLGAFTTFSTFAVEIDLLTRGGRPGLASTYAVAMVAAGLCAVVAGGALARVLPPRTHREGNRQ